MHPSDGVRTCIRDILTASAAFGELDPQTRRELAQGLVRIGSAALALADESKRSAAADQASPASQAQAATPQPPLARAQSAGSEFSGVAAGRVADTTRQILNAVSFPRFVTELINGVFKALVDTNQQQLTSFVDLIRNVASSTEGFAEANLGLNGARSWLAERFSGSFVIEGESDPFNDPGRQLTPEEQAELDAETRLRLRPGASLPSEGALRVALQLGPQDSLPGGDPENLVPLARAALARNRQQMLSTMVMLGLQRIVIESGRLHASMRFHIDTHSAAADDRSSQFDFRNTVNAAGSFGYGPWGASAAMTNTIGFVSTQKTQTSEEMNTDLDLSSSVELVFKTDYVPLDRLAGREQTDRIKVNTLNPEAEAKLASEDRRAREKRITESETRRREALDQAGRAPAPAPSSPKPGEPGTVEAADKARKDAAAEKARKDGTKSDKGAAVPKQTSSAPSPKQTTKAAGKEAANKKAPPASPASARGASV